MGQVEELVVDKGVDIDCSDGQQFTALHYAVAGGADGACTRTIRKKVLR